ncbi:hypothetical protein BY458DRAFT_488073 [Sporodiniella umbellata]|nr:hypothetical protein BY458DRAFT_488073 [Sporodiniella umbellata]
MSTIGHGPSKSTCSGCYGISVDTDMSTVNIELTGKSAYQGIVMLVKEKYTNKTVGEFKDFDENLFWSVECGEDEDEIDRVEPDKTSVLGHVDPKWKSWPVNIGWSIDLIDRPTVELKFQAMVVIDYENFHVLPEKEFKLKKKIVATTKILPSKTAAMTEPNTVTTTISEAIETTLEIEHGNIVAIKQQHNQLFVSTFIALSAFYCSLSVCLRYCLQKRKKKRVSIEDFELIPTPSVKEN